MAKIEPFEKYADRYEQWFVDHLAVYVSEVNVLRELIPKGLDGIEIGMGSGLFSNPLDINEGLEPSPKMREMAEARGLKAIDSTAENLPLADKSYDFALMVTTICFLDDIDKSFREVKRIIKDDGFFLIGFVDKDSNLGKKYLEFKEQNVFYKIANFYSATEVKNILDRNGFKVTNTLQTVFGELKRVKQIQSFKQGHGFGGFVAMKAIKK
ncbi:MAG: class I SAM-dependent methyltransferase [Candidatus Cloacimonetes bacterium]|nr:class I SAM-dependent methyltransferase [Candidatus Cloacimonadota bacterium]